MHWSILVSKEGLHWRTEQLIILRTIQCSFTPCNNMTIPPESSINLTRHLQTGWRRRHSTLRCRWKEVDRRVIQQINLSLEDFPTNCRHCESQRDELALLVKTPSWSEIQSVSQFKDYNLLKTNEQILFAKNLMKLEQSSDLSNVKMIQWSILNENVV